MRRQIGLLVFGLFLVIISVSGVLGQRVSYAEEPTSPAEEVNLWQGNISGEVVDEQRNFLRGHVCQKESLLESTYPSEISTFGRPIWTLPAKFEEVQSSCGFDTDYGFTDGVWYSPPNSGNHAYRVESTGINEFYPNSLALSLYKPNYSSPYSYLTYSKENILDRAESTYKAPDWTQRRTLTKRLSNYSQWPGATDINMSDATNTETYAHGVSENGRYIAFITYQYGTFLYDTYNQTYKTISLNSYLPSAADGGYLAVANDGSAVLHIGNSVKTPTTPYGKMLMSLYDTTECSQIMNPADFKSTSLFSPTGCREIDLTSKVYDVLGNDLSTIYNSVNDAYFHPRNKYFQFSTIVKPRVGTEGYSKKTIRFKSDLNPEANGYLAMGDSFSSGEGDLQGSTWYEPGTDEQGDKGTFTGRNLCHVSRRSYPYLLAKELGYLAGGQSSAVSPQNDGDFHSVACSGAVLHNVVGGSFLGESQEVGDGESFSNRDNQYRYDFRNSQENWQSGPVSQVKSLSGDIFAEDKNRVFSPEAITLGIGGNDVDFGKRIAECILDVADTCPAAIAGSSSAYSTALELVNMKSKLVKAYSQIKAESDADTKIYVHGYPVFVSADGNNCNLNVPLNTQERIYVEQGVLYFNKIIKAAAKEAGVFYIEVGDILDGINLCSGADHDTMAVNGLTNGNDKTNFISNLIAANFNTRTFCVLASNDGCGLGNESFHPNPKAHLLYAQRIYESTNGFAATTPEPEHTDIPLPNPVQFGQSAYNTVASFNAGTNIPVVFTATATISGVDDRTNTLKLQVERAAPSSGVNIEIHSDPIHIGEYEVDSSGNLTQGISIPADLPAGVHNIVITGVDEFGEPFEIQEPILVSQQARDFDGDGVEDLEDSCLTTDNSGIDIDQDGVDDACDGYVEPSRAQTENTDDGYEKGQPSRETVAGTDKELATIVPRGVLGASTEEDPSSDTNRLLQNSGLATASQVFVGAGVVMVSFIVIISTMNNKNKNNTKDKR